MFLEEEKVSAQIDTNCPAVYLAKELHEEKKHCHKNLASVLSEFGLEEIATKKAPGKSKTLRKSSLNEICSASTQGCQHAATVVFKRPLKNGKVGRS